HGRWSADRRSGEIRRVPEDGAAPAGALRHGARDRKGTGLDRGEEGGQPAQVSGALVIAHRGAAGYEFENSRAAFRAAKARGADAGTRSAVHGFDHRIVKRLGIARPALARSVLLASYPLRPLEALQDTGATALWQEHTLIDAALVDALHGAGYRIYAWTVDDPDDMRRLLALRGDGLCAHLPDVGRRAGQVYGG